MSKHLSHLNARERENKRLASKLLNSTLETDEIKSELAENLPLEKKSKIVTRASQRTSAARQIKEDTSNAVKGKHNLYRFCVNSQN